MELENLELLPEHIRGGVKRYVEEGIEPGGFLRAVISNDLSGAFGKADSINSANLENIIKWFYNYAPSQCWGSPEKMVKWMKKGGMKGEFNNAHRSQINDG